MYVHTYLGMKLLCLHFHELDIQNLTCGFMPVFCLHIMSCTYVKCLTRVQMESRIWA
jgi:hypothetical protein